MRFFNYFCNYFCNIYNKVKKLEYSSGNYLVTDPEGMVGRYLLPMLSARTPLSERILFHLAGTDEDTDGAECGGDSSALGKA